MNCPPLRKSQERVDLVEFLRRIGMISIERKEICDPGKEEDNSLLRKPECYKARRMLHDDKEKMLVKTDKSQHTSDALGGGSKSSEGSESAGKEKSGESVTDKDDKIKDECDVVGTGEKMTLEEAKKIMK